MQLDIGADAEVKPASSLAEFTTHIGNGQGGSTETDIDDDSEPTRIKSNTDPSIRLDRIPAYTPTVPSPALSPEAAQAIAKMRRTATTGVVTVGAVCLAIGLLIGRGTSTPTPTAEPLFTASPALAAPDRVTAPQVQPDSEHVAVNERSLPTVAAPMTIKASAQAMEQPAAQAAPPPAAAQDDDAPDAQVEEAEVDEEEAAPEPEKAATTKAPIATKAKPKPTPVVKKRFTKKRVVSTAPAPRKPY